MLNGVAAEVTPSNEFLARAVEIDTDRDRARPGHGR